MGNQRSLASALALTPEKMAFIRAENPADEQARGSSLASSTGSQDEDHKAVPTPSITSQRSRRSQTSKHGPTAPSQPNSLLKKELRVPITTRLRSETAQRLKRLCYEQKLEGQVPDTFQEIIELAVSQWLDSL